MIDVKLVHNAKETVAYFSRARRRWRKVRADVVADLVKLAEAQMRAEIQAKGLVDTGALLRSVSAKQVGLEGTNADAVVRGSVLVDAPHGPVMHKGRRRGKWPKVSGALESWAERKGVNPWAVAHTIKRKGIKGRKYVNRAGRAVDKQVKPIAQKHLARFVDGT